MKSEKFEQLCRELLEKSEGTLFNKAKEYATDVDRLANFRQPTSMTGMSQAEVCFMYQMKHICSVAKIAKESSQGILPTKELLQEKCQDMLNYTLLFYANMMELVEKRDQEPLGIVSLSDSETALQNCLSMSLLTQTEREIPDN